jgi:hypothetical protein
MVNACLPKGYTFRSNAIEESETHALCSIQFSPRRMIFETLKNESMSLYSNLEDTEQPTVVFNAYILPMYTQKKAKFEFVVNGNESCFIFECSAVLE